jgi:hypothetical protein
MNTFSTDFARRCRLCLLVSTTVGSILVLLAVVGDILDFSWFQADVIPMTLLSVGVAFLSIGYRYHRIGLHLKP